MDHEKGYGEAGLGPTSELYMQDISGKHKKNKRRMSDQRKSQSLEEPVMDGRRNPPLSRSKTYDPSFSKEAEREAFVSSQRRTSESNLMKHALNFRRVFKDLSEDEELLETFSCSWQREVPFHGRLYVSSNHICFYCSMVLREVKVVIPVCSISVFKKANTALLLPNAVCIRTTEGEKFLFGSLRSRETVYQLLRSVCKHLQDGNQSSYPASGHSSSEHLKIALIPKELGVTQNLPGNGILPEEPDGTDKILSPSAAPVEQQPAAPSKGRTPSTPSWQNWRVPLDPLNTVILIYLFLVVILLLSSGYIGLRIVQLEEQLTSMGAWPELDLQHQYGAT